MNNRGNNRFRGQNNGNYIRNNNYYRNNNNQRNEGNFHNRQNRDYRRDYRGDNVRDNRNHEQRRGRGRGRGGYRINTIRTENNENDNDRAGPSNFNPSGYLPIITILTIISLFSPLVHSIEQTYQICTDNRDKLFVTPPEYFNCTIPKIEEVVETEAELVVRRTKPLIIDLFKCSKKVSVLCTFSILKIYTSIPTNYTYTEKMSVEDCWKLVKSGEFENKSLIRKSESVWKTQTQVPLNYSWIGSDCAQEVDFVVERSTGATMSSEGPFLSDIGNLDECNVTSGFCENKKAIIVWEAPTMQQLCPYVSAGSFSAIISDQFIMFEELQGTFIFKNVVNDSSGYLNCLKHNTFEMENDVYITIPKLTRVIYSKNDSKVLVTKLIEKDDNKNAGRNRRSVKQPQRAPQTIPRPPQRVSALTTNFPPFETQKSPIERLSETEGKQPQNELTTTSKIITTTETPTTVTKSQPQPTKAVKTKMRKIESSTTIMPTTLSKQRLIDDPKTTQSPMSKMTTTTRPEVIKVSKQANLQNLHEIEPIKIKVQTTARPAEAKSPIKNGNKGTQQSEAAKIDGKETQQKLTESKILSDRILKILLRRDIPIESKSPLSRLDTPSEENANLNSRLQFLTNEADMKARKNFGNLWQKICHLHNKHIDIVRSILKIDPTEGVRVWLGKRNIAAAFYGEAIAIHKCRTVVPSKIIWDNKIGETCFNNTPIIVGNRKYFSIPGSRDLSTESAQIPCHLRPKSIFRENNKWRSTTGEMHVEVLPNILPFNFIKGDSKFTAESPYQLEKSNIFDSIALIATYANRINTIQSVLEENSVYLNDTNLMDIASDILNANISISTGNISDLLSNVTNFIGEWKNIITIIVAVGILILTIGILIYCYPWL